VDGAITNQSTALERIVPHPRTLRKAREQVKQMVNDGVSPRRIRNYLHYWAFWWVRTSQSWDYQRVLEWFLNECWDFMPAAYAAGLLQHAIIKPSQDHALVLSASGFHATA
jgi:hypothetical protein